MMADVNHGAERSLAAFIEAVGCWARDRAVAADCREVEAGLVLGRVAFDAISRLDTDWHAEVFGGSIPYDVGEEGRIAGLYRSWAETGSAALEVVKSLESRCGPLAGSERLRADLDEARGILTPDDVFFGDEALVARQEEALDAFLRGETVEFEEMGD